MLWWDETSNAIIAVSLRSWNKQIKFPAKNMIDYTDDGGRRYDSNNQPTIFTLSEVCRQFSGRMENNGAWKAIPNFRSGGCVTTPNSLRQKPILNFEWLGKESFAILILPNSTKSCLKFAIKPLHCWLKEKKMKEKNSNLETASFRVQMESRLNTFGY